MATSRQIRRPKSRRRDDVAPRPGITVDAYGSDAVDPTENVLALVDAQARFQEKFDELTAKFNAAEIAHVTQFFNTVIEAERRRVDNLADQKKEFDQQNSEIQRNQMKTTSDLVSTQLDKITDSLSDTINKMGDNFAATLSTFDKRLSGVEQFRYETGGRSSVSDPAMLQIAADLKELRTQRAETSGAHQQRSDSSALVFAIISALFGLVGVVGLIFTVMHSVH
jgi:hypothetical protein